MRIMGLIASTGTYIPYKVPVRVEQVHEYLVDIDGMIKAVYDSVGETWLCQQNLQHGVRTRLKVQIVETLY